MKQPRRRAAGRQAPDHAARQLEEPARPQAAAVHERLRHHPRRLVRLRVVHLHRHPGQGLRRDRQHRRRRRGPARHGRAATSSPAPPPRPCRARSSPTLADGPGAARADGNVTDPTTFVVSTKGKLIGGAARPASASTTTTRPTAAASRRHHRPGRWPDRDRARSSLDTGTADRAGYTVGDTVTLVTSGAQPDVTATLVGLAEFKGGTVGATLAFFDTKTAQQLYFGGKDEYTDVWVTGRGRAPTPRTSRKAVQAALPAGFRGRDRASPSPRSRPPASTRRCRFINIFLLVFAGDRPVRRVVPHHQHLLDPGRPAQPRAGDAPGPRRGPPAGHPLGAVRGLRRRARRLDHRARAGLPAGARDPGPVRPVRPRPQRLAARLPAAHRPDRVCRGHGRDDGGRLPARSPRGEDAAGGGDARRHRAAGVDPAPAHLVGSVLFVIGCREHLPRARSRRSTTRPTGSAPASSPWSWRRPHQPGRRPAGDRPCWAASTAGCSARSA